MTPFSSELQRIASRGWGYAEREHLGGWELRASGGFTSRANSAWPLGDPGIPLEEALAFVTEWYAARGLPARVAVVAGSDLDARIAGHGFGVAALPAFRQVADIASVLDALGTPAGSKPPTEFTTELPDDFFTVYQRGLGQPDARRVLTTGGAELTFAAIRDAGGAPLAIGRLAVDRASGYAGLAAIYTAEHVRRQGFSSALLRDLLQRAHDGGSRRAYLEVDAENVPALTLYERLGFVTEHAYHSRMTGQDGT